MSKELEKINDLKEEIEKLRQPAIEALLVQKKELDVQLEELGYSAKSAKLGKRAPKKCSICGTLGHTARTCPQGKR
jgi:formamidopyrimidine-DNA glycosylase